MNWQTYFELFDQILEGTITQAPYDNPAYVEYVKLNRSRSARWLKTAAIDPQLIDELNKLEQKQHWILIAEPWCADAANIAPIIHKIAESTATVSLSIELRDDDSGLIERYLTNGARAMPKLIVRDEHGNDLFTWGPRPLACQQLVRKDIENNGDPAERKVAIQKWYNEDGGKSFQIELKELLASVAHV